MIFESTRVGETSQAVITYNEYGLEIPNDFPSNEEAYTLTRNTADLARRPQRPH